MDIVTRDLQLLGSRTRYWEYGTPSSGPTIVVVHGYRGDHHGLEPVVRLLSDFHVISPDLPGFGDSTPMTDRPHSIAGYEDWLRAFLEATGLGGSILLGHSFGSIVVAHAVAGGVPASAVILVNPIADDPAIECGRSVIGVESPKPGRSGEITWKSPSSLTTGSSP